MTQLQKKETRSDNKENENLPLKTEEIISILNKTTNSKFLKSDEIIANIALNFKKFSVKEIAEKNKIKLKSVNKDLKEVLEKDNNKIEETEKIEDKKESNETIVEDHIKEKIYTKEEADKIANDQAKIYYRNGYNAGISNLKKELQDGDQAIAMALKNTIDSLFYVSSEFIEKLNYDLNKSILDICTLIIGYEIDKVPDKFVEKIKNLVESIHSSSNNVKIFLNKEDHDSINKYFRENKTLTEVKLEIDEKLKRGDLILKSGGIEVNDIVCEKINLINNSDIENEIDELRKENNIIKSQTKNPNLEEERDTSSKIIEQNLNSEEKEKISEKPNKIYDKNSASTAKEEISKASKIDDNLLDNK